MVKFILSAFADEACSELDGQIAALNRNGIKHIEPRKMGKPILKLTDEELSDIRRQLDENGIGISALGSPIGKYNIEDPFEDHLADFRRAMEICKILGTDRIRIFSFFVPEDKKEEYREEVLRRMNILVKEAKEQGITLCHENESHIYGQNPHEVRDLLDNVPDLGAIFDASNYVMEDQDPLEGLDACLDKLTYIHIKDLEKATKYQMPAGEGDGQYETVLQKAAEVMDGDVYLTVEPHLFKFSAFTEIDRHKLHVGRVFESSDAAFDCAVNSLKKMLAKLGYHEEEPGTWTK